MLKKIDLFITHAWREHSEWLNVVEYIDRIPNLTWRNFSVPWHDPALHPSRELEYRLLEQTYETQIIPCDLVFFLLDLTSSKGNMRWLDKAVQFAERHEKPIYGITLTDKGNQSTYGTACTAVVPLTGIAVQAIIEKHAQKAGFRYL